MAPRIVRDELLEEERIEPKPASVALHLRGLTDQRANGALEAARGGWKSLSQQLPLEIHAFDGGLELRAPGRDKGTAVREILATERSETPVAYLGDDTTDEDAFRALGERGLSVMVRPELRETAARVWLEPPEELLEFLNRWHAHTSRE